VGARLGGLAVIVVILALGVFLGSAISQRTDVPQVSAAAARPGARASGRVRVEVRNGSGRSGLAKSATDVLRSQGFDVVFYGNAAAFDRDSSVVLDRVGRVEMARSVADALGIPRVLSEPDSNLYLDATVVLGEDWTAPEPEPPPQAADAPLPWWSPKRWVGRREPAAPPRIPTGPVTDPGRNDS
jgi:hypothetical protein